VVSSRTPKGAPMRRLLLSFLERSRPQKQSHSASRTNSSTTESVWLSKVRDTKPSGVFRSAISSNNRVQGSARRCVFEPNNQIKAPSDTDSKYPAIEKLTDALSRSERRNIVPPSSFLQSNVQTSWIWRPCILSMTISPPPTVIHRQRSSRQPDSGCAAVGEERFTPVRRT